MDEPVLCQHSSHLTPILPYLSLPQIKEWLWLRLGEEKERERIPISFPCPALPPQTTEDHFVVLRYPRSFLCGIRATRRDLRKLCDLTAERFALRLQGLRRRDRHL
jgi:hypothetical protein